MSEKKIKKVTWDTLIPGNRPDTTIKTRFQNCGSPKFDIERFISEEIGNDALQKIENYVSYDEMAPEVIAYWKKKGLIKELHYSEQREADDYKYKVDLGRGIVKDDHDYAKWSSFVPVSSLKDPQRRYPLLFVLHGGHGTVYEVETYGHMDMAAEKEIIVIAPHNCTEKNILYLYDNALKNFPVDKSRVHITGFSYGSAMSTDITVAHPDLFAGVCLFGQLIRTKHRKNPTAEQLEYISKIHMPMLNMEGDAEAGRTLPMYVDQSHNNHIPDVARTVAANVEGLKAWLDFNGCVRDVSIEEVLDTVHSADKVERVIGAVFDKTHIEMHCGREFYIGDYFDKQGRTMMRIIGIENTPHWPTAYVPEIMWEFLSQFRRNPETKEIEIINQKSLY